jgi:hypothetical protein
VEIEVALVNTNSEVHIFTDENICSNDFLHEKACVIVFFHKNITSFSVESEKAWNADTNVTLSTCCLPHRFMIFFQHFVVSCFPESHSLNSQYHQTSHSLILCNSCSFVLMLVAIDHSLQSLHKTSGSSCNISFDM